MKYYIRIFILILSCLSWHSPFPYSNLYHYDIEEPLVDVLHKLEKDFEVHFLYKSDVIEAIDIEYDLWNSNDEITSVLEELLKDSGVYFRKVSQNSFIIVPSRKEIVLSGFVKDKNNRPLIGATVYSTTQERGVITDLSGHYSLTLKPGAHDVEVRFVGHKTLHQEVEINAVFDKSENFNLLQTTVLDEVVVLGSKFAPLKNLGSARSILRITKSELEKTGFNSLTESLHNKAPSFHSTFQTISDGTDHITPSSLRGLGPDQILVLINGKRRHHSSLLNINGTIGRGSVSTDLNTIPISAIEDIEILNEDEVALYGSDAIAGVINIKLRKNIDYSEITLLSGLTSMGDGQNYQLAGILGSAIGNKGGSINFSVDFRHSQPVDRSGFYSGQIFGDERDFNLQAIDDFYRQTGLPYGKVMQIGSGGSNNAGFFVNADIPINSKTHLYAFGGINYRLGDSRGFYRFPYQQRRQSGLFPNGFSPILKTQILDNSIVVGMSRRKANWQVDFSNAYGRNSIDFNLENSNNASLGLLSPIEGHAGGFSYFQNVVNMDASSNLGKNKKINFGFGFEFKVEGFSQKSGEESTYIDGGALLRDGTPKEIGMQLFPGFDESMELNEERISLGSYLAIETNISEKIKGTFAARSEYYADYEANFIWNAGLKYRPNSSTAVRLSTKTGFRAPSMPQVHHQSRSFQYISVRNEIASFRVQHIKDGSSKAQRLGLTPIQPETSKSYAIGIDFSPIGSFSMEIDAYKIDIDDRIVLSGIIPTLSQPSLQEIFRPEDISGIQFLSNSINTATTGISFSTKYYISITDISRIELNMSGNLGMTRIERNQNREEIINTPLLFNGLEHLVFNREEVARIERGIPDKKLIFSVSLVNPLWSVNLSATHYGSVSYLHPDDGDISNWVINNHSGSYESRDQLFTPKTSFDLSFNIQLSDVASSNFGISNILNTYPDEHTHSANISHGLFVYSRRVSQFGVRGRYIFGSINFKF